MDFSDISQTFFLTDENERACRIWLETAVHASIDFLKDAKHDLIHSDITLPALEKIFAYTPFPETPGGLHKTFQETLDLVVRHSVRTTNPRYIGHMTGNTPFFGMLVDLLISALNQNTVKIETALSASFVEGQTLAWLHHLIFGREKSYYQKLIHNPDCAFGNITSGGTLGNLTALTVARNKLLPQSESEGLASALLEKGCKKAVVLVSKRGHYSLKKSASVLGIGSSNVLEIPVHPFSNQIDLEKLRAKIVQLQSEKICVLALIGIAGSTETGSVDNLAELAKLAQEFGIWFHVDAAWGGALLLTEKYRPLLKGIEQADSVVIDGHKLFYLPMSHGAVLFKSEMALDVVRHTARYIIRQGSVDLGRTSLEGSRRFDSLKMWFFFKVLGRTGYESLLLHSLELARDFAQQIQRDECFELTSQTQTNILTYRFVPSAWKNASILCANALTDTSLLPAKRAALEAILDCATQFINDLNVDIQKQQRQNGKSFVSRTTLESVIAHRDTVVFRAVLFNPLTTSLILSDILIEQKILGNQIARSRWKKVRSTLPEGFATFFPSL